MERNLHLTYFHQCLIMQCPLPSKYKNRKLYLQQTKLFILLLFYANFTFHFETNLYLVWR